MLLAVDTSTDQTGVAVVDDGRVIAEWIWLSRQYHTMELAPAVAQIFGQSGIEMATVEAVAVAIGPGSYTALRVGLALAKGMALTRGWPMIGVRTLDVLAAGQPPCALPLAAVLRAGRGRIALGWYKSAPDALLGGDMGGRGAGGNWESTGAAEVTTLDALAKSIEEPTLVAGELTPEERQRLARKRVNVVLAAPHRCVRRPSLLAEIGWARFQNGQIDDTVALAPIYLHSAELPRE